MKKLIGKWVKTHSIWAGHKCSLWQKPLNTDSTFSVTSTWEMQGIHWQSPTPNVCSSFIVFSAGDRHMSAQEPSTSPASELVDEALSFSDSFDWTVGLLDVTLQWCIPELIVFQCQDFYPISGDKSIQGCDSLGLLVWCFLPKLRGIVSLHPSKCYWWILPQASYYDNFAICL